MGIQNVMRSTNFINVVFIVWVLAGQKEVKSIPQFLPHSLRTQLDERSNSDPEDLISQLINEKIFDVPFSGQGVEKEIEKANNGTSDIKLFPNQFNDSHVAKRAALFRQECLWTDRIVPYFLHDLDEDETKLVLGGMNDWMNATCITFVSQDEVNQTIYPQYINITMNLAGCWSYVGMQPISYINPQPLSLQRNDIYNVGCGYPSTVLHELGHALGLHHEQNRWDRDDYVKILWENIQEGRERNFKKVNPAVFWDGVTEYEFESIMQYSSEAFGKWNTSSGRTMQTMAAKNNSCYDDVMGLGFRLSYGDVRLINAVYGCGIGCPTCTSPCYATRRGETMGECTCVCPPPPRDPCEPCFYGNGDADCEVKVQEDGDSVCSHYRNQVRCCEACHAKGKIFTKTERCPLLNYAPKCYHPVIRDNKIMSFACKHFNVVKAFCCLRCELLLGDKF